jgi:hypothetical protein
LSRLSLKKAYNTPVEELAGRVREYLHLPDPSALYTLLGAVAANLIEGNSVWLMLVGPASAGGSELLNMLLGLPNIFEAGMIDSPAAFLSGSSKKDTAKDATGGLLRQVGGHGGIIMKDFTSMLSLPQDQMKKVLSIFREVYDGRWTRPTGTDGGRNLHWEGRAMFLAKVTGEIDRHHQVNASLGERWVYYRFNEGNSYEKSRRALMNATRSGWRDKLQMAVTDFYANLDLQFGSLLPRRQLHDPEILRIIRMGEVASRCRSAVVRDQYSKDVMGVKETESGTRISTVLAQLYMGMEVIGVPGVDIWRLVGKVALDSMPRMRKIIIDGAAKYGDTGCALKELLDTTGSSRSTVERAIEDLEIHGVVSRHKVANVVHVTLTDWMRKELL